MDIIVNKNNSIFIIPDNISKISHEWYKNNYLNWESDTFDIINKFTSNDKILIDIGSWIGVLSIPYSFNFSKVIAVEADRDSILDLKKIIEKNNITNIDIIEKAIYSKSNEKVHFGSSNFRADLPGLNQSTSHINYNTIKQDDYLIDTISLLDIVNPVLDAVGFIKVDIEGGEGNILDDVTTILEYNIPILISFHFPWIQDQEKVKIFSTFINMKNISYYDSFLNKISVSVYEYILHNNFCSILFVKD